MEGLCPRGCLGGLRGTVSWHGFRRFPARRGTFSVLSAMRAIKKVHALKRS